MTISQETYRVAIIGAPTDSGNRGVLALASSLSALAARGRPKVQVTLMATQMRVAPLSTVIDGKRVIVDSIHQRYTYRAGLANCLPWTLLLSLVYYAAPSLRSRIRKENAWIDCLASADLVGDIRGGDSFSDIYGIKRFLWGFLCAATALLVHGPIVQFPQTYGPYKSALARRIAAFLLARSQAIVARDKRSQAVASDLAGQARTIELTPDVAFSMEPERPNGFAAPTAPVIGINVNGLMYNGGYDRNNMFGLMVDYPRFLDALMRGVLSSGDENIWLVPHTFAPHGDVESDNETAQIAKARLPTELQKRVTVIEGDFDQHQIKGIIGLCDGFVGSRMHACIAALSQGVPCVGVAYSMKFQGVFDSVGMGDWVVDARTYHTEDAVTTTLARLRSRATRKDSLAQAAQSARQQLERLFEILIDRMPERKRLACI